MTYNLGDMIDDIKFMSDRDLTNEDARIKNAILSAISNFDYEPLKWNRKRFEFNTVSGEDTYSSFREPNMGAIIPASDVKDILRLRVILTGNAAPVPMQRMQPEFLDSFRGSGSYSKPYLWDWEAGAINLWPEPSEDDVVIKGVMIRDVSTIDSSSSNSDGDDDPWLNEGREMIRAMAMFHMYFYYLGDTEKALMLKSRSGEVFQEHRSEYERLYFSDKNVEPWYGEQNLNETGWVY